MNKENSNKVSSMLEIKPNVPCFELGMYRYELREKKYSGLRYMFFLFLMGFFLSPVSYGAVILISSIEDLQKIGNDPGYPLNGNYELTQNIDASATINWNNGEGFKPIGGENLAFTGVFNGNGHVINGLYIKRESERYYGGLFGHVGSGGEIKNVGLEDSKVYVTSYAGGLVGYNSGTVSDCYAKNSVSGSYEVGGLVGYNKGTISGCYSTGSVYGNTDVGGLVGYNNGTINDCHSKSSVTGYFYVGGLVGVNRGGMVKNCYSKGAVEVSNETGGLIGINEGTVMDSYWCIETSGQNGSAGGEGKTAEEMKKQATYVNWDFTNTWAIEEDILFPYLQKLGPAPEPPAPVIKNISSLEELSKIGRDWDYPWDGTYYLTNNINASSTVNWNGGKGFEPITPFTGKFYGNGHSISNLYINRSGKDNVGLFGISSGEVRDLSLLEAWVSGTEQYIATLMGVNNGKVNGCYSSGLVSGKYYVGGMVGENYGLISKCYSSASVYGDWVVGGLLGKNNDFAKVSLCFSYGSVLGNSEVGGLIGKNTNKKSGIVIDSCWDVDASGQSESAGGEPKTTAQMKQQATYVGWDFTSTWSIDEGISYPYLIMLGPTPEPPVPVERDISNLEDLNKIGRDWNYPWDGTYHLINDIDASATIDWDEGRGFKPITTFTGKFYGYGHNIKNILMNRPYEDYVGLFGILFGEVHNTGLKNVEIYGNNYIGGLVGENFGSIDDSYSMGSVTSTGDFGGGLVGSNGGILNNCYFAGSVSGGGGISYYNPIGGLVGSNWGMINRCYALGTISGITGVGGLIGVNGNTVTECYSSGSVVGTKNSIGGLVGNNFGNIISGCYSMSSVSGRDNVGGLVGDNYGIIVENSFAMGSVNGTGSKIGGLIGYLNGGNLINTFSKGSVGGTGSNKGGLIGYESNMPTVISSYWDTQTSGMDTSAAGTGKTTSEMKQKATFVNWDFVNIWGIIEDTTYPYLLWQYLVPDVIGMTQEDAESVIAGAGLVVGTVSQECSDIVPAGNVISQSPLGGAQISPGSSVDIVVSTGPCSEGEGVPEGTPEGVHEGTPEGSPEGTPEGEGAVEGSIEGTPEGEGIVEGTPEGEGTVEGFPEGTPEGTQEGEGVIEGIPEGTPEGEGTSEGEGAVEGILEGEGEGGALPPHNADQNGDWQISLSELLRVIQFFNFGAYHCDAQGEDGYAPGPGDQSCPPHASDYNPPDWNISLSELLRVIQFFNMGGYHPCPGVGEDGYCPGP